ncbi:restriction endonuclease subunit S [Thalassolituus marinus]|uniref:Restriction endonuclease subunit S n=1 Tax=Thalassolituus marinus TaxID=671053 RepID=A0ABS7ZLC1_9GAMM|nr:restriction endonuclease subunit S [Thalassolituus marinus]MCA6062515.1 restriction endonuclease subunit S [Thalassolituus marinus]
MSTTLLNNLELWTSTVTPKSTSGRGSNSKIELTGIKKLRELILELAVRGKLVAQNPEDEPASELLKRIEEEKALLVKEGRIKKPKKLPPISDKEKPFELPPGWEWVKLGNISSYGSLNKAEAESTESDTWVLELEDIEKQTSRLIQKIRFSNREFKSTKNAFEANDVLYGKLRPYLDKVIIADESGVCTTEIVPITCFSGLQPQYLRWFLKSPRFIEYANSSTHGMNLPRLGTDKAVLSNIALPPLAEQQRIVAKVDELMALCDQLEQQSEHQLTAHQQLTDTLLATLTESANAQELNDNWQRLANHFDLLFSGPMGAWAIDRLKDTILQLAVMGKLVPQNADDEPASKLLEHIEEEKARLVKEGRIKKPKKLPAVSDDEKPFELPVGWKWIQLGFLGLTSTGKTPSTSQSQFFDGEIPFIGPGQISPSGSILPPEKYLTEAGVLESTEALPDDILTVCIGGTIGKLAIAKQRMAFNQQINAIRPLVVDHSYIYQAASTDEFRNRLLDASSGSATPIINRSKWEGLLLPIPPLAEQRRIVAKVDELFALCDQLKDRLQQASETQLNLTDAIVEQALA